MLGRALNALKQFKAHKEAQTSLKLVGIRDNKGGEYMGNDFEAFCIEHGIARQHTTRNRPQQNGVAERFNRILSEGVTTMLSEAGLPLAFWGEALSALVHVLNRCPTSARPDTTPHAAFYGRKPDVSHLRVWGCLAYVHVQKDKRGALGSHMEKCIFIGYPVGYKGWKFYNPATKKVVISERAVFDERVLPGLKNWSSVPSVRSLPPQAPAGAPADLGDEPAPVEAQQPRVGGENQPVGAPEPAGAPPGKKTIGSRWVFVQKFLSDGALERYKARLVAEGYSQRPGYDYLETFAPTVRIVSIRVVLALSALEDLDLCSVDISHAYINGELEEEIYMDQPEGFHFGNPGDVLRLRKSLYGLKQAGRVWNRMLHSTLGKLGFSRLQSDASLYLYRRGPVRIIMPIFIDDITIASTDAAELDCVVPLVINNV